MKKILVILLLGLGFLSELQAQVPWSVSGVKTRFTKGLGIPVADTTSGGAADTSHMVIRPQDGVLYYKRLGAWQAASSSAFYVPYTGAVDNVNLGNYRLTARSLKTDSIYANGSGGAVAVTNSGTKSFSWGAGGSSEVTFYGFAGMDFNRSGSMTSTSFTPKVYVDSLAALRVRYTDTAAMLSPYLRRTDSTGLLSQVVRTFGTQTIGGNKTFTNDIFTSTARIGIGAGGNSSNSVLGYNVFTSNTTGTKNTAMGENSLSSNVSATDNTAFGWYSLDAATGSGNTGIGSGALGTNTSGSNNTALGFGAGEYVTGTNPNSTGTNSIYIGFNTKASANGETNQTVIGHNLTGNGSNTVTIGNSSITNNYFSGNIRSSNGTAFLKNMANGSSSDSVIVSNNGELRKIPQSSIVGSGGTVTSVSAGTGMSFTTITGTGAVNADTTTLATRAYASGLDVAKANTSLNNVNGVLSSTYGGAGSVSGILKANGSGVVSAAVAGDITSLISGTYLPLTAGASFPLTGSLTLNTGNNLILNGGDLEFNNNSGFGILSDNGTRALSITNSGVGLPTITGSVNMTGALTGTSSNFNSLTATYNAGTGVGSIGVGRWLTQPESNTITRTYFTGSDASTYGRWEIYRSTSTTPAIIHQYNADGTQQMYGALSGTSLSMSGGGSFGTTLGVGTASPYEAFTIQGAASRMDLNNAGGSSRKSLLIEPLGYGGNSYARIESYDYGGSSGGQLAINTLGGAVTIGTTTTDGTNKLIVNGNIKATAAELSNLTVNGAVDLGSPSSIGNQVNSRASYSAGILFSNSSVVSADIRNYRFSSDLIVFGDFALQKSTTRGGTTYSDLLYFSNTGAATFSSSVQTGGTILSQVGSGVASVIEAYSVSGQDAVLIGNGQSSTTQFGVPAAKTGVGSRSNHDFVFVTNSTLAGTIAASNQAVTFVNSVTATGFFESSSKKLKDIFWQSKQEDNIDFIGFTWKKSLNLDTKKHLGVIAEQVEKVLPDAVNTNDKGVKSVNYNEVLIYKLERLTKKVAELEQKLERYSKKAKK